MHEERFYIQTKDAIIGELPNKPLTEFPESFKIREILSRKPGVKMSPKKAIELFNYTNNAQASPFKSKPYSFESKKEAYTRYLARGYDELNKFIKIINIMKARKIMENYLFIKRYNFRFLLLIIFLIFNIKI